MHSASELTHTITCDLQQSCRVLARGTRIVGRSLELFMAKQSTSKTMPYVCQVLLKLVGGGQARESLQVSQQSSQTSHHEALPGASQYACQRTPLRPYMV
jgi:hypothetical protein